ncbi:MAG TPA: hypothetical protein VFL96_10455 [Acidobacteriaceae bacterium]|nr:hypothetical protein [Acidobacteriaceae bacterium]
MAKKPESERPKQRIPSRTRSARFKPERPEGKQEDPAGVQSLETEDPRQVGSGKRRQRELLEDNASPEGGAAQESPNAVAGLHSTGTFTGRKRRAA